MKRSSKTIQAFGLLVLALGVAGILSSGTGLLMVTPFLALLLPLLAGRYPGEAVLETLVRTMRTLGWPTAGPPRLGLMTPVRNPLTGSAGGTIGPRAPPLPSV